MCHYPEVCLRGVEETIFVGLSDIICAIADGNYTIIVLTKNRQIKILRKLKQVEQLLSQDNFIRIHRSHLINLIHLKKYKENELVEMSNGQKLAIARAHRNSFAQRFIHL